jgi:SAM-dependent methyltransferase
MHSNVDPTRLEKPLPPGELQYRVSGIREGEKTFRESGRTSAVEIEAALASWGRTLDSFGRILDFGCGCGRITMWLERLAATTELYGTDIDADALEWASEHFPYARFTRNGRHPPLPFPDDHFDLVFSSSVFTHIDERAQDLWLAEFRRVTQPGGLLLLSVHGERAFRHAEAAARGEGRDSTTWEAALAANGILFVEDDNWIGGPFPDWYHTTFHAPWYVFSRWGRHLLIRAYIPRRSLDYQDYVLLEVPGDAGPLTEPVAPAIEELTTRLATIERSRSWRLARWISRVGRPFRRR